MNGNQSLAREAQKVLHYSGACGAYLRRLVKAAHLGKGRITSRDTNKGQVWKIAPPPEDEEEA